MNGSCAMSRMPNAAARRATSWPMRPRPASPSVLSRTSSPRNFFFSHLPCFIAASAAGRCRASASTSPIASSATLTLLAPGAFMTTMPRALAAATSTLSTPVPARAIARRRGAASMNAAVTFVALRTTSASASREIGSERIRGVRPVRASTVQPSARSSSSAEAGRSSATTIFMGSASSIIVGCSGRCRDARDINRVTIAQRWCNPLKRSGSMRGTAGLRR